jgi:hypothetical protein
MKNQIRKSIRRRFTIASALVLGLLAPTAVATGIANAATTTSTSKYFVAGKATPVKGIVVSGYDGKNVLASITTNIGGAATLALGKTTGLTLAYGYTAFSGPQLIFSGSQADMNAALATLTITVATGRSITNVKIQTMFTELKGGLAYQPANNHFYKFVPGKITPIGAKLAAEAIIEFGLAGYLATITSAEENEFISSKLEGATNIVINGSDAATEGEWKFVGGPEDGTSFWSGCHTTGSAVNGAYTKWNPEGEPNNYISNTNKCGGTAYNPTASDGEDCIVTNWAGSSVAKEYRGGYWNDFPCNLNRGDGTDIGGYVVEFGNKANGGDFQNVDFGSHTLVESIPKQQLTFGQKLVSFLFGGSKNLKKGFKIFVKPKKEAPKELCPRKPKLTKLSYTLILGEPGRYSVYLTNDKGKRIVMECGTSIGSRGITQPVSSPVLQSLKANDRPVMNIYVLTSSLGKTPDYPLLNVILRRSDGTLERQDQPIPPLPGSPLNGPIRENPIYRAKAR